MGDAVYKEMNLIYFIYFNGKLNHYHELNLQYLRKYWGLFSGQKVVKIAVDGGYDISPILELLPDNCKYELVKNDPNLGEAKHFLNSLDQVSDGMTFYAHCKGVSRPIMAGLDIWIKNLYEANLERIPDIRNSMFSGICCKFLPCPPYVPEPFHYSGSFYWFNTAKVKERLKAIEYNKYLTERFPAIIANQNECLFGIMSTAKNLNFYEIRTWL